MSLPEEFYTKQKEAALRRMNRLREKQADPVFREKAIAKQQQRMARTRAKQLEKLADPAYREKLVENRKEKCAKKSMKKLTTERPTNTSIGKKKTTRGLMGRTPTADERRIMDLIGSLGCIACLTHGKSTLEISLHHIAGRTTPDAHKKVLGLCDSHHQHAAPKEIRAVYPWLVPVHACGSIGGRAAFEKENGTQIELLKLTYDKIGQPFPF